MFHMENNKKLWPITACFVNGEMYLSMNELTGLYKYDLEKKETEYIKGYENHPQVLSYKNRKIVSDSNKIFLFPFSGESYEIFDVNNNTLLWSEKKKEGYACFWECEYNNQFFIFEYNNDINLASVMIWDKREGLLLEWKELTEYINECGIKGVIEAHRNEMSILGDYLIIGLGESSEYIIVDLSKRIFFKKSLGNNNIIYTICSGRDNLYVITKENILITLDLFLNTSYYYSIYDAYEYELYEIIMFGNKLFALCHYDLGLYKIFLDESEKKYHLESVIEKNGYKYDMFLPKWPYKEWVVKDTSLFLIPLDFDDVVEYIFENGVTKKILHSNFINDEHINEYIDYLFDKEKLLVENNGLGKEITTYINYIVQKK